MEFLAVFGVSMLPMTGIREGLILGLELGFPTWAAYGTALLGDLIPIPFWMVVLQALMDKMEKGQGPRRISTFLSGPAGRVGRLTEQNRERAVLVLAAIPFLSAAAWIWAAVAVFFRIRVGRGFLLILIGEAIAGLIVLLISLGAVPA